MMYRSVVACINAVVAVVVAMLCVIVVNDNCVLRWFVVDLSVNPRACCFDSHGCVSHILRVGVASKVTCCGVCCLCV